MRSRWGLLVALGLVGLTGQAGAEDAMTAGDKAELQLLKERMAKLERKIESQEAFSGGISSTGEKPTAMMELPSGLQGLGMSGFVDTSFVYNFAEGNPATRTNRGRVFDVNPSGFAIQAAEIAIEKPVSDESPIGFRTDLYFGDDAELIHSTGLGETAATGVADHFDLQQAYVVARAPIGAGIDFKVGKFVTLLGAEVIESLANWNFSRSYMFGFAIPFTHTGALVSYPIGELGSVTGGVVNGWDIVDDNNNFKSLIGNITLTPMEGVTLAVNGITGAEQAQNNRDDRTVVDVVASWQATDKLAFVANYDYGFESAGKSVAGFDSKNWTGLALYAKYDINDKWAMAGRVEWFDDKDNFRTGLTSVGGATPSDIDFYGYTLTSQWKLHEHVLARLEYRHDKADEQVFFQDTTGFTTYQDTIAAEMIYHF